MNIFEELERNPFAFHFFRAVRLIECHARNLPRVGYAATPSREPVRFAQKPSLAFAPSTLECLEKQPETGVPMLFVRFFGLFGPNAPLPPHLTEYAFEREHHHGDATFRGFCNVFHHRLLSFFYRAWSDHQKTLDLDRPEDQRFVDYIGSFAGLGMASLQGQDAVQDWAKLYFSGRLATQPRNAEGIEAILAEYFDIPARVVPFVGRWMNLPENAQCRLGESPDTGQLGLTTLVGERMWECQLSFRIQMGPMSLADYERMLPGGAAFKRLEAWVRNYCGLQFHWDLQLILRADEVPDIRLGRSGKLGWTCWLKTKPFTRDASDLVVQPPGNN